MRGPRGPKRCGGRPLASSSATGIKTARFREQLPKRQTFKNCYEVFIPEAITSKTWDECTFTFLAHNIKKGGLQMVNCSRDLLENLRDSEGINIP